MVFFFFYDNCYGYRSFLDDFDKLIDTYYDGLGVNVEAASDCRHHTSYYYACANHT